MYYVSPYNKTVTADSETCFDRGYCIGDFQGCHKQEKPHPKLARSLTDRPLCFSTLIIESNEIKNMASVLKYVLKYQLKRTKKDTSKSKIKNEIITIKSIQSQIKKKYIYIITLVRCPVVYIIIYQAGVLKKNHPLQSKRNLTKTSYTALLYTVHSVSLSRKGRAGKYVRERRTENRDLAVTQESFLAQKTVVTSTDE